MVNIEVRHLQLIRAIAEEGSITRAGVRLNLTQSALSHRLIDLERQLGTLLFDRVGKHMAMTAAGNRLLQCAKHVLDELDNAESDVRLIANEKVGELRLTTECYTCYHWLPALLESFSRKYPGVELRIDAEATRRALDALREGSVDLALTSSTVTDSRLEVRPVFEDELICIVAPQHKLASHPYVTAELIAREKLLLYNELADSVVYNQVLRPAGLVPSATMRVPLTEAMIELARSGAGIAVMPRWSAWPHISARTVIALRLTRQGVFRAWHAAIRRRPLQPSYLTAFITLLAKQPPTGRNLTAPDRRDA